MFFRRQHVTEDFQLVSSEATRELCFAYYGLEKYREANPKQPLIFGTVTQWRAIRLTSAFDHTLLHLGLGAEKQS